MSRQVQPQLITNGKLKSQAVN